MAHFESHPQDPEDKAKNLAHKEVVTERLKKAERQKQRSGKWRQKAEKIAKRSHFRTDYWGEFTEDRPAKAGLTREGRKYLKCYWAMCKLTEIYSDMGVFYIASVSRFLVRYKPWLINQGWWKQYLKDVEVSQSKVDQYLQLWKTFRNYKNLTKFKTISYRKLVVVGKYIRDQCNYEDFDSLINRLSKPGERKQITKLGLSELRDYLNSSLDVKQQRQTSVEIPDRKGQTKRVSILKAKNAKSIKLAWSPADKSFQRYLSNLLERLSSGSN